MLMDRAEARIANRIEDLPVVVELLDRFGEDNDIPLATIDDLNVALDEALSNIIAYAYPAEQHGEIVVRLALLPGQVVAEVEDTGRPFDPLAAPPPDLAAALEERQLGGVGIHFIKTLMDDVSYARIGDKNVLRLTKRLPAA
jgi:serine/threonine-protein kinase RsbW